MKVVDQVQKNVSNQIYQDQKFVQGSEWRGGGGNRNEIKGTRLTYI